MLAAEGGHEAVDELRFIAGANANATIRTLAKSPLTQAVAMLVENGTGHRTTIVRCTPAPLCCYIKATSRRIESVG